MANRIDSATGLLTIDTLGTYTITVTVTDSLENTDSETYNVSIPENWVNVVDIYAYDFKNVNGTLYGVGYGDETSVWKSSAGSDGNVDISTEFEEILSVDFYPDTLATLDSNLYMGCSYPSEDTYMTYNGTSWTTVSCSASGTTDPIYDQDVPFSFDDTLWLSYYGSNIMYYSENLIDWIEVIHGAGSVTNFQRVSVPDSNRAFIGSNQSPYSFYLEPGSKTWTAFTGDLSSKRLNQAVILGDDYYYACVSGSKGYIYKAPVSDFMNTTLVYDPSTVEGRTINITELIVHNGYLVIDVYSFITGVGYRSTLLKSTDGINWNPLKSNIFGDLDDPKILSYIDSLYNNTTNNRIYTSVTLEDYVLRTYRGWID